MFKMPVLVTATLALAASAALGIEEQEARTACERVMSLIMIGQQQPGLKDQCRFDIRGDAYWRCTEQRMQKGENFDLAAEHCEKLLDIR